MHDEPQGASAGGGGGIVEHPAIAVLSVKPGRAAVLASVLRCRGFRSRHFVNARVLLNAARQFVPVAIITDAELLTDPLVEACAQAVRESTGAFLVTLQHREGERNSPAVDAVLDPDRDADELAQELHRLLYDTSWRQRLKRALREDGFRLAYQPIVHPDGSPSGLHEVLVRLHDSARGEIMPGDFLPPADRLGLRRHIDHWVMQHALDTITQHSSDRSPTLFVKLFPETILTADFFDWLTRQLRRRRTDDGRLVIELPCSDVMATPETYLPLAAELRTHRCAIALGHYAPDDPAGMHQDFPADYLMLAPALMRGLADSHARQRYVQAVISHARRAGARTIATHVQNPQVMTHLWQAGVDYVQGYFLHAPSPELWQPEAITTDLP